jgi:prepilin-type N-terminal cleavage/methylation domain-containing protein
MKNDAFTFVELMVVMAIIGILTVVSANSLMSIKGRNLKNDIYGIQSDLWWLRQKAIATHNDLQMLFYSNSSTFDSYCICRGGCPTLDRNCLYMTNANVISTRRRLTSDVDASPPPYVNVNGVSGVFTIYQANGSAIQLNMSTKNANVTVYDGTGYVQENFF